MLQGETGSLTPRSFWIADQPFRTAAHELRLRCSGNTLNCRLSARAILTEPSCSFYHFHAWSIYYSASEAESGRDLQLDANDLPCPFRLRFAPSHHCLLGNHHSGRLRTGFGRRMGYLASAPGSRPYRGTLGLSPIFPGHPRNLETARRCRVGHSGFSPTQGVGLRRCDLRLDGRCCIAIGLGVHRCGYAGIPDRNDGSCSCVLGAPSAIAPPWFRLNCHKMG